MKAIHHETHRSGEERKISAIFTLGADVIGSGKSLIAETTWSEGNVRGGTS